MKKRIIIGAIMFLMAILAASAHPAFYFPQTIHQDNKDIRHDRTDLARNRAKRDRDIKEGKPKAAERQQHKVNQDKRDLHHDVKNRNQDLQHR